jgi:hypothetical protein
MRKLIMGGFAALTVGLAIFATSTSVAQAGTFTSENTVGYIAALEADGMPASLANEAVVAGEQACTLMASGMSQTRLITGLQAPPNPVDPTIANALVTAAATDLCPTVSGGVRL